MINAKDAVELTKQSIVDRYANKWTYIEEQIKIASTAQKYECEFNYLSDFQLDNNDVHELVQLGYEVETKYKNETSYIVSWKIR